MVGVIPGRGLSPDPSARRLTFMVGFWDRISARPRGFDCPGPGQPVPSLSNTKYAWVHDLVNLSVLEHSAVTSEGHEQYTAGEIKSCIDPIYVSSIWEPITSAHDVDEASDTQSLKKSRVVSSSSTPSYDQCFQGF